MYRYLTSLCGPGDWIADCIADWPAERTSKMPKNISIPTANPLAGFTPNPATMVNIGNRPFGTPYPASGNVTIVPKRGGPMIAASGNTVAVADYKNNLLSMIKIG